MNRCFATGMFGAAVLILGIASAHGGRCTAEIAQLEQAVRQSAGDPNAGPMLSQTVGAQVDRQPTPALVARAEKRAKAAFDAVMRRAKRLDAHGDRAGCKRALARARAMYNM